MDLTSSRNRLQAALVLAVLAVALAGCRGESGDVEVVARSESGGSGTSAHPALEVVRGSGDRRSARGAETRVTVDVAGSVRRPGVYLLAAGSRVHEAIEAAGGVRPGAELASINRAAVLVDAQQVFVPARGGAARSGGPVSEQGGAVLDGAAGAIVSINAAGAALLDSLPGIGPVTAQHIVDDRTANGPFASVDELDRVPGIGPGTIDELRASATT